jgi:hypothetical protein
MRTHKKRGVHTYKQTPVLCVVQSYRIALDPYFHSWNACFSLLLVTQSTSSTLILDRCPASFPAILGELLAGIGDVEIEISPGERAAFSGPELGAVIVSSPEAWWALVKKTYDPTILV